MRGIMLKKTMILLFPLLFILVEQGSGAVISKARIIGVPEKFYSQYIKPLEQKNKISAVLKQSSHNGTYREIGRSIAHYILKTDPDYKANTLKLIGSIYGKNHPMRTSDVAEIKMMTRNFFPDILDEIQGFAEVMEMDPDDAVRIYTQHGVTRYGACTILAVGREKTKNGSLLIGRSYEWLPTLCDLHIIKTAPNGAYKSVGSADFVTGRLDGINEHGLFIGMTGVQSKDENRKGFFFPIIVRAVLDKAKSVDEAIDIVKKISHSVGSNFLIADKSGMAAVVEMSPFNHFSIRYLKDSKGGFLLTTNHFLNSETRYNNKQIMPNSFERIHIIARLIQAQKTPLEERHIINMLRSKRPDGVFVNNYSVGFGTLYSGIYDTSGTAYRIIAGDSDNTVDPNHNIPDREISIEYENTDPFLPDYISTNGYDTVDQNSCFFRYEFYFMATPVIGAAVEFSVNYKIGLFSTERTYGPHISAGLFTFVSPTFLQSGIKIDIALTHVFSLQLIPFYQTGWSIYHINMSDKGNAGRVTERLKDGIREYHHCPGLTINPVINIFSFIMIENRFTVYNYDEQVYDYRSSLLVRRSLIWSPQVHIMVPFSQGFLWGIMSGANYEFSGNRYNAQVGPILLFPKLFANTTLAIIPAYWIKLTEGGDRLNITIALRGQI